MKLNKTIIISDIISIFIAFGLFVWIFIEMKCVAIVYDRILNNLFIKNFNPVQKVSLSRNLCQESGMYSLINYTFPGIPDSCYDSKNNKVEAGECKTQNSTSLNIKAINQKNFTIWRNKIICASYFENDASSYKLIDRTDDAECDIDYKQCGYINHEAEMTNLHKILCVKKEIECPLNYIAITDNISSYENSDEVDIYSFENNYYLVTSNKNITNGIITKIKIAEGKYPCYEKDKYSNSTSQFPTINQKHNFNCSTMKFDESSTNDESELRYLIEDNENEEESKLIEAGYDVRYIMFDSYQKANVLKENDLDYSYSRLPNVSNWKQDMYTSNFSLFYQNVFIVKEECDKYDSFESNIIKLKNVQSYRVIFALFHILIYVLLFSILGLIKVIMAWRHSLLFGIKVGLSFIIFGVNFKLIFSSEEYNKNLKNFDTQLDNCLDKVAKAILDNHDIKKIIEQLEILYYYEKILWYVYIFFNFIEACRLIHKIYIRCKNTYRRNIANRDIGYENLKGIFENVRNELEKKIEKKDK